MKLNLPTIKTQDIELLLRPLGFSIGFNPDRSNFFTNGIFKIEFLTPQGGKGTDKAVYIKPLKISATPLRYLRMLLDQQMEVEKEGYKFMVPSPWVLAYHKILIAKNRRVKEKKGKDRLQAIAILTKWKSYIKGQLAEYIPFNLIVWRL